MTEAVVADAQFGVARVLKPFEGFESVYQGVSASIPIAFPGGLDRSAGSAGFDSNLARGVSVPYGSKIMLWFPLIISDAASGFGEEVINYRYTLVWRLRNLRDFSVDRRPYHYPRSSAGANDQVTIPAAVLTVGFQGSRKPSDSVVDGDTEDLVLVQENVVPRAGTLTFAPLLPGGATAAISQGVSSVLSNQAANYSVFQTDALGDELIVLATREAIPGGAGGGSLNWDFQPDALDSGFSAIFGDDSGQGNTAPDSGIYLFTGANP